MRNKQSMGYSTTKLDFVIIIGIVLISIASFTATIILERNGVFDDAYITYRYSNHLAQGYGFRWNIGEDPTEGFTNILLVISLVPFIKSGIDPLLATRVLSILAALGLGFLFSFEAKTQFRGSYLESILLGALFLPLSFLAQLSMIGLETVIFTFFLFLSFLILVSYLNIPRREKLICFGFIQFLTFLLRPEGLILSILFILFLLLNKSSISVESYKSIAINMLSLGLPLMCFMAWKLLYFSTILPNPFYIKASSSGVVSGFGLFSVLIYYIYSFRLVALAAFSSKISTNQLFPTRLALWFIIAYTLFYVRIDTLMDFYSRFLYPITPFLFYITIPAIISIYRRLSRLTQYSANNYIITSGFFILLFIYTPNIPNDVLRAIRFQSNYTDPELLMQKEITIAKKLSQYKDIRNISIAFGDAGVIPYYTDSEFLDLVGLNDHFIARERDIHRLTDYLFGKKTTLIILPTNRDFTPINYGHGPLGDYSKWSHDPRWDDYVYIGSVPSDLYILNFFVRMDDKRFSEFSTFLIKNVVEELYLEFPGPIGSTKK
jgi:arabinofuranosyltransferase